MSLPWDSVRLMVNLHQLSLDHNLLDFIPEGTFTDLERLARLDLTSNRAWGTQIEAFHHREQRTEEETLCCEKSPASPRCDSSTMGPKNRQQHFNKDTLASATQVHGDITEQLHAANVSEIQDRREYLKRVAAVTAFLGKQGIAFRGHNEAGESDNKGHFMECMKLLENFDPFLQTTYKPPSCVTYLSPSSQNDMIESTADVIMARIISEIKEAKMYSVMVDEARDNHTEQLALCVQYVNPQGSVKE
ncbi:hypothetical protein F7725_013508, partial [Dissostichus mawsoni]